MSSAFCSIIVLNYNGEKIIANTLVSLENLNYPKDKYEVIIVDNGSKDKSRKVINSYIKERSTSADHCPLTVLYLDENLGFAAGNNVGIRKAKGKYIALLNNDCVVENDWLAELVAVAEKDEKIFAVNSKIMLGNTHKIQNAGIRIFTNGYARDIGAIPKDNKQEYEEDIGQYEKICAVDAACGAAVLYRTAVLQEIGLLEESFFLYYEDVEISERAKTHGYKILYTPKAIVHHIHAASSEEGSPFFIYHSEKGRLLHMIYHGSLRNYISEYVAFGFKAILRLGYGLRHPNRFVQQLQYMKTFLLLFVASPYYLQKRIQLNKSLHFNIAYEISPLLATSGSSGEKSGLYRLLFTTIQGIGYYLSEQNSSSRIYLFSYYPSLLDTMPRELSLLLKQPNIKLITVPPYNVPPLLRLFHGLIRFVFRHTGNVYSQSDYKERLVGCLRQQDVQLIHHSETCFFDAPGFINTITINDLVPIKFPQWCQEKTIENMKKKLMFAQSSCQGIICISKNTKMDLLSYWGTSAEDKQIEVIYPPISPFIIDNQISFPQLKLQIPALNTLISHHYFLAYGTYEPRKNLTLLVQVFSQLFKEDKLNNFKLVLVGGKGWGNVYENIQSYIQDKYIDTSKSPIIQLGYMKDDVLHSLISNSKAVLYPTLYEGYGYPITESLQFGVPIITSENSSLPEACQGKCLITSNDIRGWKDIIIQSVMTNLPSTQKMSFDIKSVSQNTSSFYQSLKYSVIGH